MLRLTLALLLAPSVAFAQLAPKTKTLELGTLLNNVSGNASASSLTFTIGPNIGTTITTGDDRLEGYTWLDLRFNHSAHSAATAVTMTCTTSEDGGTTKEILQDCTVASGACTSDDASWSKAVSGTKKWRWRVGIKNGKQAECVVALTAGDGTDKITVKGKVVAP
jgi:hypothetical protein